jgi:hypothetical protein
MPCFPWCELNHVVVDRDPEHAADLGYASFRGSLNLYSHPIGQQAGARLFSYDSFDTSLIGTTVKTAAAQVSGDTGLHGTIQYSHSDGAISESGLYETV